MPVAIVTCVWQVAPHHTDVCSHFSCQEPTEADAAGAASPLAGPAHEEEGPATAGAGGGPAAPLLNSLQQQWAPEPEEEEEEEEEEENVGQWSPAPLDAQHVGGQDVVHEDDDQRLLDLLRKQVGPCLIGVPGHGTAPRGSKALLDQLILGLCPGSDSFRTGGCLCLVLEVSRGIQGT